MFHIKFSRHFVNFQERKFPIKVLFLPKVKKKERLTNKHFCKIFGKKYKQLRRHLEYSHQFDFSRLTINFLQ
jgi:hypothetical protein